MARFLKTGSANMTRVFLVGFQLEYMPDLSISANMESQHQSLDLIERWPILLTALVALN